MATQVGLGIPLPKLLPITGTWVLPFATWGAILSARVVLQRRDRHIALGDSSREASGNGADELLRASRAHANFLENVPLALTLAAIAELNGANKRALNYILATLLALRVVHVELGLKGNAHGTGIGRPIGYAGTQTIVAGLAAYGTYLVKGYWGF